MTSCDRFWRIEACQNCARRLRRGYTCRVRRNVMIRRISDGNIALRLYGGSKWQMSAIWTSGSGSATSREDDSNGTVIGGVNDSKEKPYHYKDQDGFWMQGNVKEGDHSIGTVRDMNVERFLHMPLRIILVRHGESEGNIDVTAYTRIPDRRIQLVTSFVSM